MNEFFDLVSLRDFFGLSVANFIVKKNFVKLGYGETNCSLQCLLSIFCTNRKFNFD